LGEKFSKNPLSFGFIFQRTGDKGTTLRLFIAAVADGEMALQAP
jgi:hypothetical protein